MTLKVQAYNLLLSSLKNRVLELEQMIKSIQEDKSGETKSVVGDKYETSRAMMQMEEDQIKSQLSIVETKVKKLKQLDPRKHHSKVENGTLVQLNTGWFFISVAADKNVVEGQKIYFLSPEAPLARALLGNQLNAKINFNGQELEIEKIN